MEYIGNREYWDMKFINRGEKLPAPEITLVENLVLLKKGTVLDVACGDGRNSLFLAENGFQVTGIDFSNVALTRLKMFAEVNNYNVNTLEIDLSFPHSLDKFEVFDNILINHYRLTREQLFGLENHISDNGTLFICGFGEKHKTDAKISEDDLIRPSDFEDIKKKFELIKYIENQNELGYFVTYIYRKMIFTY